MARSKCWCFTFNNYTNEEYENLIKIDYKYIILGFEKSKEGTPHIQGYIEFNERKMLTVLKKYNNKIHWEIRRGSQKQAIDYCMKDGIYEEYGKKQKQGERTDLNKLAQDIMEGADKKETIINNAGTYIKYHNGLDKLFNMQPKKDIKYEVNEVCFKNDEDINLLKSIKENSKDLYICLDWEWDDYNYEETIAIYWNEKIDKRIKYLRNGLKTTVNVKYGIKNITSKYIYIFRDLTNIKINS